MISKAPKMSTVVRHNAACARALWPGECSKLTLNGLRELTTRFGFSVRLGEIRLLNGVWYVTNSGLIRLADRRRCRGISTRPILEFSDPVACRWVFRATVYKSSRSKGFVGYGDADPSNLSSLVQGAEMRVAETRAVNRALRKAYGIGLCSVEELGFFGLAKAYGRFNACEWESRIKWLKQWSAPATRSTLPADPPAQSRS